MIAKQIDVKKFNVKIMDMKERTKLSWTALATLLAPISWGTTYVTITEFLPDGRPLLVAASRVVPAGMVLLLVGRLLSSWRPRGVEWRQLGAISLFNFGIFFPLLVVGVYRLPGGVAAATGGLQPILVILLTTLINRERGRRIELAVGIAAAVGVALIVIRPGANIDPLGVIAAVAANVSFAIGVVLTKRYPTPGNKLTATGWQMLMSGVILVPLFLAVEGVPASLTMANLGGFAYLSLAGTALAFVLWFNGIRKLPVAGPPLLGLAAPITGAALGWWLLNESLSTLQIIGFIITIAAIAYGAALRTPPTPVTEPTHLPVAGAGNEYRPAAA